MSWLNYFRARSKAASTTKFRQPTTLELERLEDRVVPATADLVAYRPVTDYFTYTNYAVSASQEGSHKLGPGIRFNGDDDNGDQVADYLDSDPPAAAENDLIRVDVAASGISVTLTYTGNLRVWTEAKDAVILSGTSVSVGAVWVEYIGESHTVGANSAVLTLTASDGGGSTTDKLVFHSFQSVVIAIGGLNQDPANVGDSTLGVFTMAVKLYKKGYDVHMYKETEVSNDVDTIGQGAAYNEVVSAVNARNVDYVAIYGFSYGGGATYELANGLQANALIQGDYTIPYTAYIDAITHGGISSERRLPPGTQYHDNLYQRRDWFIRGNSVTGANNINVTNTTWGSGLVHTTIDDNATVQSTIIANLTAKVVR